LAKSGFQIPAGSFTVFNVLTLTLWILIYDRLIVPQWRKITQHESGITMLQRMGAGIGISILGMAVSSLVEKHRRDIALHKPILRLASGGGAICSMSSLWLRPQLILFGHCEAFSMIGQTEFFYHQFPENMRSIGMSVFCLGQAISSYISGALVNIIHKATGRNGRKNWLAQDLNEARFDLYYMTVAGIAVLNLMYFIVCAKWYQFNSTANSAEPKVVSEEEEEKALSA
jgi:dipeptide/tripeptide permease